MIEIVIQGLVFVVVYFALGYALAWYKEIKPLRCIWFGHRFRKQTQGLTDVNGWPVFQCRRCHRQWIPAPGYWGSTITPKKLDRFERFQIGQLPRASSTQ